LLNGVQSEMAAKAFKHQNLPAVTRLSRILPIFQWLPAYQRESLRPDITAGLTLAAFTIPEAIAYAELAGLPATAGLYAAIAAPILYMLFGTSRQLAIGPTAAVSVLVASGLGRLAISSPDHYAALAATTAVLVGVMALVSYGLRLGFLVNFISESVLVGFSTGAAVYIAATQLNKLFGVAGSHGHFLDRMLDLAHHIGATNVWALGLGIAGVAVLLAGERAFPRLPWALIVVLGSIGVMNFTDLGDRGVRVVGEIPSGFPLPALPPISLSILGDVLRTAVGAFILACLDAMSMARMFARKNNYRVDPNHELLALGVASLGAGLIRGYPVDGSFSRTALNDECGAKTQLANGISGLVLVLVVLFLTGLFTKLPEPILAAVVLVAVRGLFKVSALRRLYRLRPAEFWTAIAALSGVLVLGILDGVIIGALLSLLLVIARASESRISVLAKVPGQPQFTNVRDNPENIIIPGLLIIRVEEGIFYANAESIRDQIMALMWDANTPIETVILDLEMTSDLDLAGAEMLDELHSELRDLGVRLRLARLQRSARVLLARARISRKIGNNNIHPRTLFAVAAYLAEEGAAQRLGCDIVPDMIRCVQDLVLQRCELEIGSDREMLDDVCRQLDGILECLEKINCKIP
jgi:sulfate permease, SulP family